MKRDKEAKNDDQRVMMNPKKMRGRLNHPTLLPPSFVLIFLMMSIPVVSAQQLEIDRVAGAKGVQEYVDDPDRLTIVAKAIIPGVTSDVARSRLRIVVGNQIVFFEECVPEGGGFTCTYSEASAKRPPIVEYRVELLDAEQNVLVSEVRQVSVDNIPPTLTVFNVEPELSSSNQLLFSIEVVDFGVDPANGLCSGIKAVRIVEKRTKMKLLTVKGE